MSGHHHHSYHPSAQRDVHWLSGALLLNLLFALIEITGGFWASSMTLVSDGAHMLVDALAIGLALGAGWLSLRPAGGAYSFGWGRSQILSAQANGIMMCVLGGFIALEAVGHILEPPAVRTEWMIYLGAAGLVVNLAAAWMISKASRGLHTHGAWLHNLYDMLASLGAVAAGLVIWQTGWSQVDGLVALLVSILMLRSGWGLLRDSGRILLEAAPRGMEPAQVGPQLARQPGVQEVHDLHIWEIGSGSLALSAHVLVGQQDNCHLVRLALVGFIREELGISHTTLQVEHIPAELIQISAADPGSSGTQFN